jgi:hypothetical protein
MPVEALVVAKAASSATSIAVKLTRAFERYSKGDPNILLGPLAENYREWVRDLDAAVAVHTQAINESAEAGAQVEERIAALESDRRLVRIWNNLGYDAMREALEERRAMLADAAVALALSPLPIERKARIERTLRDLDPVDVCDLYGLARIVGSQDTDGTKLRTTDNLRHHVWASGGRVENAEILLSAGCVYLPPGGGAGWGGGMQELRVSRLGAELLSVMGLYAKRRGVSFEIPGRGPAITTEELGRAQHAVAEVPGLAKFLVWTRTAPRVGKQYAMPFEGTFVLPDGSSIKRPFLQVNVYDGEQRSVVGALAEASRTGPLRVHVGADISADDAPGAFTAHITGPHEILRVLAEGDDWWWV